MCVNQDETCAVVYGKTNFSFHQLRITNYQLPYDAYASRLANTALAVRAYTSYQLPTTNYQLPTTNYPSLQI